MAHNPFDDFANDFRAALPGQQIPGGNPSPPDAVPPPSTLQGTNAMNQPSQTIQPPQQFSAQQVPAVAGISNGMAMNGAGPPQQHSTISNGMYYAQPPQPQQTQQQPSSSALVPSLDGTAPNSYASMLGPPPMEQQNQAMAPHVSMQGNPSIIQPSNAAPPSSANAAANPFQGMPSAPATHPAPVSTNGPPVDSSNPFAAPSVPGAAPFQNSPGQVPLAFHDSVTPAGVGIGPSVGGSYGVPAGHPGEVQQFPSQRSTSMVPASSGQSFDPISISSAPPANVDPFGAAPVAQPAVGDSEGALVPASAPVDDPFGVFAAPAAPAQPTLAPTAPGLPSTNAAPPPSDDPWADMGFGPPVPDADGLGPVAGVTAADASGPETDGSNMPSNAKASSRSPGELPPGGEWYDARIFTPTLGVMFFKPQELTDSLFLQTDKALVDALDDRPVVAFIVEGSSARSAGVELGHVLLKVNGIDVKNPKEASRLIKEGPRPLPLLFYVPDTTVVVAEGEHMVKYDTRETGAPNSAKDWKPKYVVIGGIIAQPWMMNMYRSKSEYDIAVIETQARRPVSVKVKQFSLQGARIQNDWQGPQMVKYKNKLHPWKYIVVLPVSRNPIKISSPNLSQLKPVHEGIRRVLMAQQRDRGHPSPHTAAPVRQADPYSRNGHDYRSNERSAYQEGGMGSVRRQNQ